MVSSSACRKASTRTVRRLRVIAAVLIAGVAAIYAWITLATLPSYLDILRDTAGKGPNGPAAVWVLLVHNIFSGLFALMTAWRLVAEKAGAIWFWLIASAAFILPAVPAMAHGQLSTGLWIYLGVIAVIAALIVQVQGPERLPRPRHDRTV